MNNVELIFEFESGEDVIEERLELAAERLSGLKEETLSNAKYDEYFKKTSGFVLMVLDTYRWAMDKGPQKDSLEELKERNHRLFEDILPDNYKRLWAASVGTLF